MCLILDVAEYADSRLGGWDIGRLLSSFDIEATLTQEAI
jgi:hypothetical protein